MFQSYKRQKLQESELQLANLFVTFTKNYFHFPINKMADASFKKWRMFVTSVPNLIHQNDIQATIFIAFTRWLYWLLKKLMMTIALKVSSQQPINSLDNPVSVHENTAWQWRGSATVDKHGTAITPKAVQSDGVIVEGYVTVAFRRCISERLRRKNDCARPNASDARPVDGHRAKWYVHVFFLLNSHYQKPRWFLCQVNW